MSADLFTIPPRPHTPLLLWRRSVACPSLLLSQTLTAALHLKMHVPRKNRLSHHWSEGAAQQRLSHQGISLPCAVFILLPRFALCQLLERCPWLSLPPFPPLNSPTCNHRGGGRGDLIVTEITLVLFFPPLETPVINASFRQRLLHI